MKKFIGYYIAIVIIMFTVASAILACILPLLLARVYGCGWYFLLYFVTVPTWFAAGKVIDDAFDVDKYIKYFGL